MAELYAEALYESLIAKPTLEHFRMLSKNLRKTLKRRGHERLEPHVYRHLSRRLARGEATGGAFLTVAREEDLKAAEKKVAHLLAENGLSQKQLGVRIDPDMIGGYELRLRSRRIDASYRSQLIRLFEKLRA